MVTNSKELNQDTVIECLICIYFSTTDYFLLIFQSSLRIFVWDFMTGTHYRNLTCILWQYMFLNNMSFSKSPKVRVWNNFQMKEHGKFCLQDRQWILFTINCLMMRLCILSRCPYLGPNEHVFKWNLLPEESLLVTIHVVLDVRVWWQFLLLRQWAGGAFRGRCASTVLQNQHKYK